MIDSIWIDLPLAPSFLTTANSWVPSGPSATVRIQNLPWVMSTRAGFGTTASDLALTDDVGRFAVAVLNAFRHQRTNHCTLLKCRGAYELRLAFSRADDRMTLFIGYEAL